MQTLFDFEESPQEPREPQPLKDWQGNEIPTPHLDSDNPMVRAYRFGPDGKKCKACKFLLRDYYHNVTYRKCEKRGVTRGKGTDHKVSFDACSKFEEA
jgi:hypothetical protein